MSFPDCRQGRLSGLLLLCLFLPLSGIAAEALARREAPVELRFDKPSVKPSPFRLEIQRSEYRLDAGVASTTASLPKKKSALSNMIDRHAHDKGIDPALVHAVIRAESDYRPGALSPKGAIGLMQVMPATGKRFGVSDLDVPERNLKAGTTYLRYLLDRFDNVPLALAAYNAGEGAVSRHGNRMPPYRETQDYVQGILRSYRKDQVPELALPRSYAPGVRLIENDLAPYRLLNTGRD